MVIAAAGSFAAISTLLGSPLTGAFLLMEVSGLGGAMLGVVLVPGLLAAGVGSLIFVGLNSWTGFGTFSLAIPDIPSFTTPDRRRVPLGDRDRHRRRSPRKRHPTVGAAAPACRRAQDGVADAGGRTRGRRLGDRLRGVVRPQLLARSSSPASQRFRHSSASRRSWTVGALVLLVVFKSLAYGVSLSAFRGGPDLPRHVHRRGRRHRPFPPSRSADDCRGRDGHRSDDRGHVGLSSRRRCCSSPSSCKPTRSR